MKRKRSLQGVFLMEKCEMKGLIKTDSVIVILYFVKIFLMKIKKTIDKLFKLCYTIKVENP
mgnify:FL=1